jgi:putative endonuclease
MKTPKQVWQLYILQCSDGSLYTGITTNLEKRFAAHESGKGAKYTRGRAPLKLVYTEKLGNKSKAAIREAEIKSLERSEKLKLIEKGKRKTNRLLDS